jgi:hypothetical protein
MRPSPLKIQKRLRVLSIDLRNHQWRLVRPFIPNPMPTIIPMRSQSSKRRRRRKSRLRRQKMRRRPTKRSEIICRIMN